MGTGMADNSESFLISGSEDVQRTVPVKNSAQVHHLAVHLAGAGGPCQSFAYVKSNVNDRFGFSIFFY